MKKETPPSALSSQLQRKRAKMTFFPPLPLSLRAMQTADKKVEEEGSVIRGFCSRSQSPPKRCAKGGRNPDENCTWSRFQLAKMIQVFRPGPDPPRLSCVLCLENVFLLLLRLNGGDRRDGRDGGGKKITSPRFSSSHSRQPLVLHPPYFLPPGFGTLLLLRSSSSSDTLLRVHTYEGERKDHKKQFGSFVPLPSEERAPVSAAKSIRSPTSTVPFFTFSISSADTISFC